MEQQAAIRVKGLTKRFGPVCALDSLDLTVARGASFGLLGQNGAGKTTAIQLMLGLTSPDAGSIEILGLPLATARREILARVNFSSAYVSMPSNLTVVENLTVFGLLYGLRRPARKIQELLELLEIPDTAKQVSGSLSSGQLTRANLCKALLNDPEVLFLDEPTASLDPAIAAKVRATLTRIRAERGTTLIYTSHNMREVEQMCEEIVFLRQGREAARGTPAQVRERAGRATLEEVFIDLAEAGAPEPGRDQEGGGHVA
jgi:ABC-2 type transport system ATP-binding protein